jgi:DNA-binding NtrC family response regulator
MRAYVEARIAQNELSEISRAQRIISSDIWDGAGTMLEQSALSAAGQEDPPANGTVRQAAPRLLVIDDDNLHRMVICRAAAKAGYLPAGAASYDEAVKLVQQGAFDCVTLDLSLGEHAGVEMLRYFWVIGYKMPVIIFSARDDATCSESEKVAESLKLNIWESIPKPVDVSVLRASLDRLKAMRDGAPAGQRQSSQISPA